RHRELAERLSQVLHPPDVVRVALQRRAVDLQAVIGELGERLLLASLLDADPAVGDVLLSLPEEPLRLLLRRGVGVHHLLATIGLAVPSRTTSGPPSCRG